MFYKKLSQETIKSQTALCATCHLTLYHCKWVLFRASLTHHPVLRASRVASLLTYTTTAGGSTRIFQTTKLSPGNVEYPSFRARSGRAETQTHICLTPRSPLSINYENDSRVSPCGLRLKRCSRCTLSGWGIFQANWGSSESPLHCWSCAHSQLGVMGYAGRERSNSLVGIIAGFLRESPPLALICHMVISKCWFRGQPESDVI